MFLCFKKRFFNVVVDPITFLITFSGSDLLALTGIRRLNMYYVSIKHDSCLVLVVFFIVEAKKWG